MGDLQRRRPTVIDGRLVDPLPAERRAAVRWLNMGRTGVLAGTVEQIGYTRQLIEAEGVPIQYDAPVATGRGGELLVNFRIGEPAKPRMSRAVVVTVCGSVLAVASGIVWALVALAEAVAANLAIVVGVVVLVALLGVARPLRHLLRIDIWG